MRFLMEGLFGACAIKVQIVNLMADNFSITASMHAMGHVENFSKTAFGSSIFIIIVSPVTILANILLLHPSRRNCAPQLEFAGHFPAFPVSISASIVFAFTLTQYIVVASPLKYGRMITKKKAFVSVVAVYLYHTFISCLPLMGVPRKTKDAIDLFFHDYAVVLITIEVYVILHYTMKKKMATGRSLQNERSSTSREERRHIKVQRSFARLNVVLLIMIVLFVP
ncbi:unnamed protein product [Pocillopora meandrina]|uniref:G-protein coupled receptors family 1 profile domain-containing protein n=1 Tax=Pocillopora meandrina TaxID=46732 RepID=A0AAU9X487_9CNID|nr:unnamed protein product [Pocillopora meandrina]